MLIQNVFVENAAQATDIRITDGKFERLEPGLTPLPGEEVIDGSRLSGPAPLYRIPRPPGHLPDCGGPSVEPIRHPV